MTPENRDQRSEYTNNMDELLLIAEPKDKYSVFRARFVYVVVVLYFSSFISSLTIQSQYIYAVIGEENGLSQNASVNGSQDISNCNKNKSDPQYNIAVKVQQLSARWILYSTLGSGLPSVFSSVILGSYSDTAGRKFLFAISALGLFLKCAVSTATSFWNLPLYVLVLGNTLDGISGSAVSFLIATFTYTADISRTGRSRTFELIVIEGSLGLSVTLASLGMGYLIKDVGYTIPFFISSILTMLSLLSICVLPETRPFLTMIKPSRITANYIYRVFNIFISKANNNPRVILIICLINFLFAGMITTGRQGVETLYTFNEPLCWDSVGLGVWNGASSGSQSLSTIILTRLAQFFFSDAVIGLFSVVTGSLSFILEGLSYNAIMMYLVSALRLLIVCSLSMLRVIMSKLTRPEDQGAVFASIACVEAITVVTGNVLFNAVYEVTLSLYRGIVFFVMAFILAISSVLYIVIHFAVKRHVAKHGYASVIEGPPKIEAEIQQEDIDKASIQSVPTIRITYDDNSVN